MSGDLSVRGLGKHFTAAGGERVEVLPASRSSWARGRRWRSPALRARARARCSTSSARSTVRPRGTSRSAAAIPSRCPSRSWPGSATARSASSSRTTICCRSTRCWRTCWCRRWPFRMARGRSTRRGPASCSNGSAWGTGWGTGRPSCRVASGSGRRWRGRCCTARRLLLCDEPTGSLDRVSAAAVADLLFELHEAEGTVLVVVTHSLELAGALSGPALRAGRRAARVRREPCCAACSPGTASLAVLLGVAVASARADRRPAGRRLGARQPARPDSGAAGRGRPRPGFRSLFPRSSWRRTWRPAGGTAGIERAPRRSWCAAPPFTARRRRGPRGVSMLAVDRASPRSSAAGRRCPT